MRHTFEVEHGRGDSVLFILDIRQDPIYREFGRCVNYQYRTILTQLYRGRQSVC